MKISTYSYDCECVLIAGNGDLNVKYYNGKFDAYQRTYSIFDLERGVPTFAYELDQAVEEGYLVDHSTREHKTKIMEDGIHYDQLSEEEKEEFEETFSND